MIACRVNAQTLVGSAGLVVKFLELPVFVLFDFPASVLRWKVSLGRQDNVAAREVRADDVSMVYVSYFDLCYGIPLTLPPCTVQ